jgi:hypothetical protein
MANGMHKAFRPLAALLFTAAIACRADTFINRQTAEVLHGYATSQVVDGKTVVYTQQKGRLPLDLSNYDIHRNQLGRNNTAIVISIEESILLEIETQAIEKAIASAADRGPLFILLQIDSPGGRVDLAKRICAAIANACNCEVIAFITGGKYGGAFSAATAIALACDRIYIAPNAALGAAALMTSDSAGPKDLEQVVGETVSEKMTSAWRGYLGSLAAKNNRPSLLAMAMVDKDIEVLEVSQDGQQTFVEPANQKPQDQIIRLWSRKGSLLTLTAPDSLSCRMADGLAGSQQQLLTQRGAESAKIIVDTSAQQARKTFEKVVARFERLVSSLDYHRKQLKQVRTQNQQMVILRSVISDYEDLIRIARNYPDIPVTAHSLEKELNSAQAAYNGLRMQRQGQSP